MTIAGHLALHGQGEDGFESRRTLFCLELQYQMGPWGKQVAGLLRA
jgi:hypothetical protein